MEERKRGVVQIGTEERVVVSNEDLDILLDSPSILACVRCATVANLCFFIVIHWCCHFCCFVYFCYYYLLLLLLICLFIFVIIS